MRNFPHPYLLLAQLDNILLLDLMPRSRKTGNNKPQQSLHTDTRARARAHTHDLIFDEDRLDNIVIIFADEPELTGFDLLRI